MKLRVVVSLLAVFLFLAMACGARAQDYSKFEAFGGYSYVRANPSGGALASFHVNGGEASLSYNAHSWLSGVMDFGGYHTTRDVTPPCTLVACPPTTVPAQGNLWTYMFGPR